ncbi:hypothetical protein Aduo_009728 [Ancylostoma duodenale]
MDFFNIIGTKILLLFRRIFGLISKSNELVFRGNLVEREERLPNQTFYYNLLYRDPNTLNFTNPSIHEDAKVIVLVCSALSNTSIRDTIRRTWANPQLSKAVQSKQISVVFLVGTGKITDSVWKELRTSADMLQVDVQESYANLVYKILAAYRWIHENHPEKFVLKMDSDIVALLDKVEPILGNPHNKTLQCYSHTNAVPVRKASNPWYVPLSVYPEYYLPEYCSGPVYLMSPAALSAILQVAPDGKVFEVEDAFFTGLLAGKAGVRIEKRRGIWHREKLSQPCVRNQGTVIAYPVHGASPTRLAEAWDHLRTLRCRWPVEHFLLTLLFND